MFYEFNLNPEKKIVGDCVVRAIGLAMDQSWDDTHADLSMVSHFMHDMPSSNAVWGEYLSMNGYKRYVIPNTCPACYTIKDFTKDNVDGTYILATGSHVVTTINGNYYDTWDCGDEIPIYYWRKEN